MLRVGRKDVDSRRDISPEISKRGFWSAHAKMVTYLAVALAVTASAVSAGWAMSHPESGLVFTAHTDKDTYSPGELIKVSVKFTNKGIVPIHLTFGTSAKAYFSVYASNGSYVCGIPVMSLQVITKVTIGPGQSVGYGAPCDQDVVDEANPYGIQVPPGKYYIVAGTIGATARTATFTISDS